jgi:glycosyltransferase involved in cell wall biosynthesis
MGGRRQAVRGATVDVVHNWSDGDSIRPTPIEGHRLRAEWGWQDRFVVLYSGNLGLAHEFETVLDAAELLRDHPRVLFAFVGSGPRRGEVEAGVAARKLANVEMRPHVERESLGESLTAGDVHLITLRERMPGLLVPSKIYGILAAGRPTIYVGPREGEIPAILDGGACGACVRSGDARALAEAILAYDGDPDRCEREGGRARATFEERFARPGALERLRSVIEAR